VRRRISLLVLSLLVILPVAAAAQSPPGPSLDGLAGGAKLDALVGRVVASQQALRSMRADFVQVKRSALLLEDARSSGEFSYRAPDSVRWDYRGPDRMVVLIADGTVTTYYPDQARAEQLKISKKQRRFVRVLSGTQPLDDLTTDFTVTLVDAGGETPYLLKLQPVSALLKKRLSLVELKVDRRLFLPVAVEIREADGDSTRYEFDHLVINPDIDDSRFRLELGADVRVVAIDASAGVG
jgi:outer membrane lipoprotein carrier protein